MNTRLQAIRSLASREIQDRYIVHGTSTEYLLPGELMNDALEFVRLVESGRIGSQLADVQRVLLGELKDALLAVPDTIGDIKQLIASKPWSDLQLAAARFIAEYDHSN